jgi:hypothetical protein
MRYLVTAASFNMIDLQRYRTGNIQFDVLDIETAAEIAAGSENAIGHDSTAVIVGEQLFGHPLTANRVNVRLVPGDDLVVAQYEGPRLEPGATTLPEGAKITYIHVRGG